MRLTFPVSTRGVSAESCCGEETRGLVWGHNLSLFCMLVCWDSVYTLEIITRTLREVVNRERLCGTSAFYFGGFRNFWGCQTPCRSNDTIYLCCMLVCLDSVYTLEIITRTLREVVNRERLCGTNTFYFGCFRNLWGCHTPCRSTYTI